MNLLEVRCILCKHLLPLGAQEALSNTAKDLLHGSQKSLGEIITNIIISIYTDHSWHKLPQKSARICGGASVAGGHFCLLDLLWQWRLFLLEPSFFGSGGFFVGPLPHFCASGASAGLFAIK